MANSYNLSLYFGRVESNIDPNMRGRMEVSIPEIGIRQVKYTTPFGGGTGGGFWAVPTTGSIVVLCTPSEDSQDWYYLGSLVEPPLGLMGVQEQADEVASIVDTDLAKKGNLEGPEGGADLIITPDPGTYDARGMPMKYLFKSPKGHCVTLSDQYDPTFFNNKLELKSSKGKKVELNDSPKADFIAMTNEHGDKIKISSSNNPPDQSDRAITVDSVGPHSYRSRQSGILITVVDGKNIEIINNSRGTQRETSEEVSEWGKVNITGTNNDVNILAGDGVGTPNEGLPSVYITTNGEDSIIQIHSSNRVNIVAQTDIDITSTQGNINMTAEQGDIKLSTPLGKIELN